MAETKELLPKPEGKANVLVLGGCGFIGRHLVKYLVDNELASSIRVSDKSIPAICNMSPQHKAAFDQKNIVEFKQADLSKDDHVAKAFKDQKFNIVINLCGETRFGLPEGEYKTKCFDTAAKCAVAAKANGVERWVEVSTAQVYEPGKKAAANEEGKLKPWTVQATYRLKAEEAVQKDGPPCVILRPALVWGPSDLTSLTPRLACAAVYKQQKEKMSFLWDKDLKVNCVHVSDVVAAIWATATKLTPGSIYNLEEGSDLAQGALAEIISGIFGIKTGFHGSIMSSAAKLNMSGAAAYSNDKHVPAWTKLCQEMKVFNSPVSPFIDKELLYDNKLWIDGTKITKDSDFRYQKRMSQEGLREVLDAFIAQGLYPNVLTA